MQGALAHVGEERLGVIRKAIAAFASCRLLPEMSGPIPPPDTQGREEETGERRWIERTICWSRGVVFTNHYVPRLPNKLDVHLSYILAPPFWEDVDWGGGFMPKGCHYPEKKLSSAPASTIAQYILSLQQLFDSPFKSPRNSVWLEFQSYELDVEGSSPSGDNSNFRPYGAAGLRHGHPLFLSFFSPLFHRSGERVGRKEPSPSLLVAKDE